MKKKWIAIGMTVMIMAAVAVPVLFLGESKEVPEGAAEEMVIAKAAYPEQAGKHQDAANYLADLRPFFQRSMREVLSGAETENRLYAPINVYMALALLAEMAGGESRDEILSLLQVEDTALLQKQADAIWNAHYYQEEWKFSTLANSVWLAEGTSYQEDVMNRLADQYYVSSFRGEMGSARMNQAYRSWLNEATDGLLKDTVSKLGFDKKTVLGIASTVFYSGKWLAEFDESKTEKDIFHTPKKDVTCAFMNMTLEDMYYEGDTFSAIRMQLQDKSYMWIILPNEEVSVEDVLQDGAALRMTMGDGTTASKRQAELVLSIPKFDLNAELGLVEELKALGVTKVFDSDQADFTPAFADSGGVFVSEVFHAVRLKVDEEGVVGVALTEMSLDGAVPADPLIQVPFIVNRPFLFVLTGSDGIPLFSGVVNNPLQ